jgi:PAS domain S-box-containing protein
MKASKQSGNAARIAELEARLAEAEETLRAIRSGEVDALVVAGPQGDQVFTLRGAETTYRLLIEEMSEGALLLGPEGTVLYANARFAELAGVALEQVIGSPWERFFEPAEQPRLKELLQAARTASVREEFQLQVAGAAPRPVQLSLCPMQRDEIKSFSVVVADLTERKAAEQALRAANEELEERVRERTVELRRSNEQLRESEERLRVVRENSPDGFLILRPIRDGQGRVIDFTWVYENDAGGRMNGTDPKAVVGRRLLEFFPGLRDTQILKVYQQVAETGERCVFEDQYGGETMPKPTWFRLAVVPAGGDIAILAQDITKRKEFQAELERLVEERTAKLQEMVGELEHFSYSLIHDMRAPLRAMQGFAHLMTEACTNCAEEEPKNFLRLVMTSAERMDLLITDALNYSKAVRQELALMPVDTGVLLRGMLDSYPELQPSKANIEIQGGLPVVMGNEAGLTQCFSNLLNNAVKFVKAGQEPQIRIRAEQRDGWARIWVEDEGIGIAGTMLPRVFDMFARGHTSYEGTGIGLALVRKVMARMGGKAGVESEEGKGSRFWIELKLAI